MATTKKPEKATKTTTTDATPVDSLGLNEIGRLLVDSNTGPQEILIANIIEDPNQPRTFFDENTLEELAASIKSRGVKTPISIRHLPEGGEKFIINHGARRFRASIIAGKTTIPAIIDDDYTEIDQFIENLQRDNLTPNDTATFIQKLLDKGEKKISIAAKIGKSNAFVTQYAALNSLPPSIKKAFDEGRTQDVTVINDLAALYKKNSVDVDNWLTDTEQEINRTSLKYLKDFIKSKSGIKISETVKAEESASMPIIDNTNKITRDAEEIAPKTSFFSLEISEKSASMPMDEANSFEVFEDKEIKLATIPSTPAKTDAARPIDAILHVYSKLHKDEGYVQLSMQLLDSSYCMVQLTNTLEVVKVPVDQLVIKHIF